ncbi:MAG TPA: Ku protein [Thermoanaerobaculia bacterium]|jgi:DNA end-binding protein Ku|nr:Ku protein [Thermoanaerobaculia bacterium]
MAARAIWKGVVHVGTLTVPVKLYSAVQDRAIRFRLLHKADKQPVKQQLISAESDEPIDYAEVKKAFPITRGRLVMLEKEELEKLEPKDSRDIEITRFVAHGEIDHRWYERAYYLGPDGDQKAYFAAAAALQRTKKEGVARWVMRDKSYVGALRAEDGYLMLITLRHAEEIIAAEALKPPGGRPLAQREIEMAGQLLEALHDDFDAAQFKDEYRARVMELVETKAAGRKPKVVKFRPKKESDDVTDALAASLAGMKKRSARG